MPKVKLRKERLPDAYFRPPLDTVIQWRESLPFFFNRRGVLIHRVRSALTFVRGGVPGHSWIHYLCSNTGSLDRGELLAEPPADRLVCAQCEAFAASHGMPSADELCGRHVHVGKIRAEQTCCRDQREAN